MPWLDRLLDLLVFLLLDRWLGRLADWRFDWLFDWLVGGGRGLPGDITLRALADQAPTHETGDALGTQHRNRPAWAAPRSRAEVTVNVPEAVWAAGNRAQAGICCRGRRAQG